jgi:hypothetical protein
MYETFVYDIPEKDGEYDERCYAHEPRETGCIDQDQSKANCDRATNPNK